MPTTMPHASIGEALDVLQKLDLAIEIPGAPLEAVCSHETWGELYRQMAALVEERKANGPYSDLFDFASRVDPRVIIKRQLENLVL